MPNTYQQLQDDVAKYLNRRDVASMMPGWVSIIETEISETVRSRFMVKYVTQPIDNPYITLPPDFASMESIRDANTGEIFVLKDSWSGSWTEAWPPTPYSSYGQVNPLAPATAYRIMATCIEILPHPQIPDPPDPNWTPQQMMMGYFAKPTPLVLPSDTNVLLDMFYGLYLYGCCREGAIYELDDDRATQMDSRWQATVTRANLWSQQSQFSGSPYREEMSGMMG